MSTATSTARLTREQYFAAEGLSNSGMKHLAVSPLRYWHRVINPNRPPEPATPEMTLGSALHCAVLEPREFQTRYAPVLNPDNYPDALETIQDVRGWITDKGVRPKGTLKADVIAQALAIDPHVPILDALKAAHAERNAGKVMLSTDEWRRVEGMALALGGEERLADILNGGGESEVPLFAAHPETGVALKSMLDWTNSRYTIDLKTFTQKRGKSIDRSVADAVFYEKYYQQAYFYTFVQLLQDPPRDRKFLMVFVESEEPYEVRLKELKPGTLYWDQARLDVRNLIELYADYWLKFGDKPWRDEQEILALEDEDIPQLAY